MKHIFLSVLYDLMLAEAFVVTCSQMPPIEDERMQICWSALLCTFRSLFSVDCFCKFCGFSLLVVFQLI